MRRLLTSTPLPAALGLVVALLCFFPQTCSANICWSWSTCGTTPLSPVTPMVLSPVIPMVSITPMVSMGAVQQWPTVQPYQMPPAPVLNPFAPVVPAAAAVYMPYTYGYYTYASTSSVTPVAPVVPTAWGGYTPVASQGAAFPFRRTSTSPVTTLMPRYPPRRRASTLLSQTPCRSGTDPQSPHQHGLLQPWHRQRQRQPSSDGHQHLRRPDRLFAGVPGHHGPGEDRGQGFQANPGGLGT